MTIMTCVLTCAFAVFGIYAQPVQSARAFDAYQEGFQHEVVLLQTLLDRQHLSCNCIDGTWGPRTEIALLTWQTLRGLPATGIPDAATLTALGGTSNLFMRHTVSEADLAALQTIPATWEERAALPALGYETIQEMLAERGHLSQRALQRLNPDAAWPNPPAGTDVVFPNCTPAAALPKASSLRISLSRMEVVVYGTNDMLIALFPCSIAAEKNRRPDGVLTVSAIAPNPNYTYDPQLFAPGGPKTAKLILSPGPNNPVGLAWISLSLPGYGIHGTPIPERIGRAESKGCFRLANWNAVKLVQMVAIGTPVMIEE